MLILGSVNTVFANNDNITIKLNGEQIYFNDTQPQIVNGRTMIPLRGLFEKIGATVTWNNINKSVIIEDDLNKLVFYVNSKQYIENKQIKTLDVAPCIINERTLIPIRFLAEGLDFDISWDNTTKTVVLENKVNLYKISGVHKKELDLGPKGYYVGETKYDKPYGNGILYKSINKNKKIYEGTFISGKYFGIGTLYYDNGTPHVVGQWNKGNIHGYAHIYDEFGNVSYVGYFNNDKEVAYLPSNTYKVESEIIEEYLKLKYNKYYKGEVSNGKPNGFGTIYDKNDNIIYEGYFIKGNYDGTGKLYENKKLIYKGEFKNNNFNGIGTEYKDEKISYKGNFDNNKKTGEGDIYIDEKLVYTGELYKGKPTGDGVLYDYRNEEKYFSGEWKYGHPINGNYYMTSANFDIKYKFINSNYELYLEYWDDENYDVNITEKNGDLIYNKIYIYKGDLENDKISGFGKLYNKYTKDLYYEGEFKNGNITGEGIEYYSNEDIKYEGTFKNGEYDGFGYLYYSNNNLKYHGYFENGKYEDEGILFYSNGKIEYDGDFRNGNKYGTGTLFNEDGDIIYEGKFRNNRMTGEGQFYNENEQAYKIYESEGFIVKNGIMIYDGDIVSGLKQGTGKEYYDSGIIKYNGNFYNNKYYGFGKYYSETGEIEEMGYFAENAILFPTATDKIVTIELDDNSLYIGEIELQETEYIFSGNGKLYYPSGNLQYDGEWANNNYHGQGILYDNEGNIIYEGIFVNGEYSQ